MKVEDFKRHNWEEEITADLTSIFDELDGKFEMSLVAEQVRLEIEGHQRGEDNFFRKLQKDIDAGRAGSTPVISKTIRHWYGRCLEVFKDMISQQENMGRGTRMVWYQLTKGTPADVVLKPILPVFIGAAIQEQEMAATAFASYIGKVVEDTVRFYPLLSVAEVEWKKRYEKAWSTRSDAHHKREFVKRAEAQRVEDGVLPQWNEWTSEQKIAIGYFFINLIKIGTDGAFRTENRSTGNGKKYDYTLKIFIDDRWVEEIVREGYHLSSLTPNFMPMVIQPKPWTSFNDGGYWSVGGKRNPFISSHKHRNIVKRQVKCSMPLVYEAVNIIQDTSLKVNPYILQVLKDVSASHACGSVLIENGKTWALTEMPFVLLKQKFREEIANNPEGRPTKEQIDNYRKEAHKLKANERAVISRRRDIDKVIGLADKFVQYPAFYIPHHPDFRGRVYPAVNGELHQQRDDVSKSLLVCAEGKPMGERGWYWLRVCCASLGEKDGTKNALPDVRAQWVKDNIQTISDVVANPIENIHWWADADKPFQFLACCKEVMDAINSGNPEEFVSGFPINFDGSCSGIQHYSCMTLDEVGGLQVNLIPSDTKHDLYGAVAIRAQARLKYDRDGRIGSDVEKEYSDGRAMPKKWQMAQYLLDFGVNRSFIKQNVMTYSYSSTIEGMKGQLLEQVKDVYGEQSEYSVDPLDEHRFVCCRYLAEIVHSETGRTVVKAAECMDWLQSVSVALARVNKGLEYVTPDGFPMFQEYLKQDDKRLFITNLVYDEGVLKAQPKAYSPQIKVDTDKVNSREQASSVAPNFIHSMDATHLRMTVRNCYAKGVRSFVMIHDSFGTIPADAQIMYDTVRETMVELYSNPEWDMLDRVERYARKNLTAEEFDKLPPKPAKGNLDLNGILNSTFAFL